MSTGSEGILSRQVGNPNFGNSVQRLDQEQRPPYDIGGHFARGTIHTW